MSHALTQPINDRSTRQAMIRGARGVCPSCGEGKLFTKFLKVTDECPNCHEEFHHHRADDGPAYLTVLLVSHLVGPLLLVYYIAYRPSPMMMVTVFSIGCIILSLLLLPRFKGAIVGLQWARRMHGFKDAH